MSGDDGGRDGLATGRGDGHPQGPASATDGVPWAQAEGRMRDILDRCADNIAEQQFEARLNQPSCHAQREVLLRHMKL